MSSFVPQCRAGSRFAPDISCSVQLSVGHGRSPGILPAPFPFGLTLITRCFANLVLRPARSQQRVFLAYLPRDIHQILF